MHSRVSDQLHCQYEVTRINNKYTNVG